MNRWTLTDWSEGTKGFDTLLTKLRRREAGIAAFILAIGCVGLLVALDKSIPTTFDHMFVGTAPSLFLLVLLAVRARLSMNDSKNLAGVRLDLPVLVSQYPVSVTYKRGRLEYGIDRGVVMFAGGSLVFQGIRSRFSFGGSLGLGIVKSVWTSAASPTIGYEVGGAGYSVNIALSPTFPGTHGDLSSHFVKEFEEWRTWEGGTAVDRTAPPLGAHIDAAKSAAMKAALVAPALLWLLSIILIGRKEWTSGDQGLGVVFFVIYVSLCLGLAAFGAVKGASAIGLWRKAKDRRYVPGCGGVTISQQGTSPMEPIARLSIADQEAADALPQET